MKYIIRYDRVCLGVDLATFFMAGLDDENWGQAQIPVIIKKLALSKKKKKKLGWEMYSHSR